jgi:hypothetical protein
MEVFLQHVGQMNVRHIEDTVTHRRSVRELLQRLPASAPEREFFERNQQFKEAFPNGHFNCWACPSRAEARFQETHIGDLVLIVPTLGNHDSGIHYLGIVKAKCPMRAYEASRILWPDSGDPDHLYPFLFFFDTEIGFQDWFEFLEDLSYDKNFNPRGYYLRLKPDRFEKWNGPEGYLRFLREKCGFKPEPVAKSISSYDSDNDATFSFPEEVAEPELHYEGAVYQVSVNAYERNPEARRKCIEYYGASCFICKFNFGEVYGEAGEGFIHVHHLQPLAQVGEEYEVNPVVDLRPVCPNCHAIIHRRKPAYSIEEVKTLLSRSGR